jgi:hypothetical protein
MTHRTAIRALSALLLLATLTAAPLAVAAEPPAGAAATGVMPLDLNTGKIDTTPLAQTDPLTNEAFDPQTPPQTVEGTIVSVDEAGQFAIVHTKRHGDVKMGLPPDVYVSSKHGEEASVSDMKAGDRVWATVETAHGVRAIRIAFAPPTSPLISWIGIPLLLLIALAIWITGRKYERQDDHAAPVKA